MSAITSTEPIIDAAQKICDPHHHLMDNEWARYHLTDLLADLRSGHNIVSTVYVEAGTAYCNGAAAMHRSLREVEYIRGLDAPAGVMAGIVAFADLRLGNQVQTVLDALEHAAEGRLRGVRFMTAWDPHPELNFLPHKPVKGLLRESMVQNAIKCLGKRGLPLDCWMYAHQLNDLVVAARASPDQIFILDHMGTPLVLGPYADRRAEVFAVWRQHMTELAKCPNVRLKIGGLALEMQGGPWKGGALPDSEAIAAFWRRDVLWCIEHFGTDRCMFEGNFPIDRTVVSYASLWNAYKRIIEAFSSTERDDLLHSTAQRTYLLA